MLALIVAHPYPERSRANRALLEAVHDLPGVEVRRLYELYPGFDVDVREEQALLTRSRVIVWQHPTYWYAPPALMKHWFEKVLLRGWAYGRGGTALAGKRCFWVTTTGGEPSDYRPEGMHAFPFSAFVPAVEQTARFCHMHWEPPLVLHGAHEVTDAALRGIAAEYRARIEQLLADAPWKSPEGDTTGGGP